MAEKLIINFAPTGMIPTKKITPHVPVTANEVIEDVHRAADAGISMAHLHARDEVSGEPTYSGEVYAQIIEGVRKHAPELIVCTSLSGRNFNEFEKRSQVLELEGGLKPDMGSLTLSSLNFNRTASVNSPDMIQALAQRMQERGIRPELEAFDAGMINYAHYLIRKGLITPPFYFNLLLGNIACAQPDLLHAGIMIRDLPENSYWSMAGIGDHQFSMNSVAIAIGGGVRVGLEDNIWYDQNRTKKATNLELVQRIHRVAEDLERPIMSSKELRLKLNLKDGITEGYGMKEND